MTIEARSALAVANDTIRGRSALAVINDTIRPPVPVNLLSSEQATMEANTSPLGSTILTSSWASNGATLVTFEWSTDNPASGTRCLHVVPTFTGGSWPTINPCHPNSSNWFAPCTAGKTYTAMVTIRLPQNVNVQGWVLNLGWFDNANVAVGTIAQTALPRTAAGWVQSRVVGVAPAGATRMRPSIQSTFRTTDGTYYLDQCGLFEGDVATWYAPAEAWRNNLLTVEQATMETNTSANGAIAVSGWQRNTGTPLTWTTAQADEGTHSLLVNTVATTAGIVWCRDLAGAQKHFPVVGGRGYQLAWRGQPAGAATALQSQIAWYAGAASAGNSITQSAGAAGAWRTAFAQAIAPPTADSCVLLIGPVGAANNEDCYVDRVGFYEGFGGGWWVPGAPRPERPPAHPPNIDVKWRQ